MLDKNGYGLYNKEHWVRGLNEGQLSLSQIKKCSRRIELWFFVYKSDIHQIFANESQRTQNIKNKIVQLR